MKNSQIGRLEKLITRYDNRDCDDKRSQIFDPSVAQRMLCRRFLFCDSRPENRDDRAHRVGQIVHRIRRDRDRVRDRADDKFQRCESSVEQTADPSGPDYDLFSAFMIIC